MMQQVMVSIASVASKVRYSLHKLICSTVKAVHVLDNKLIVSIDSINKRV